MFDFLKLESEDDKLITYLGLMRWLMTVDDEFHDQERAYLEKFVSHLDDNKRNELSMKVKNINLPELVERVKKLSQDDQKDLIEKLIQISAVDGNINGKEAYVICFLAKSMNMNVDVILEYMVKEHSFNQKLLDDEIERMDNQYSTNNLSDESAAALATLKIAKRSGANMVSNRNVATNKSSTNRDSSKVIGYRRHTAEYRDDNNTDSSPCSKCGNKNTGTKFCTNCGNKLIF